MKQNKTINELLKAGEEMVSPVSDTEKLDCHLLLAHVLNVSTTYLKTWPERDISEEDASTYLELITRRSEGEPIAHIIGSRGFWDLDLEVNNQTLIPRPDTEVLVEEALAIITKKDAVILDLGTGTGAIALAIASEKSNWQVFGSDLFESVVALATRNSEKNNISNCQFFQSNWFENVSNVVDVNLDLIVSNPPYIKNSDPHLDQGDVKFEPRTALVAENDGLSDIISIISASPNYLNDGGWLMIEHGYDQAVEVQALFAKKGYTSVRSIKDYGGNDRATLGQFCKVC